MHLKEVNSKNEETNWQVIVGVIQAIDDSRLECVLDSWRYILKMMSKRLDT